MCAHKRFGRGRGDGIAARSTALCMGWMAARFESRARNAAIESLGDLRTADDFGMEPVSSSSAGAGFAPLLTFRSAMMLNTRIAATTMLSRVWRPESSQRAASRFRIVRALAREAHLAPGRRGNYEVPLNRLLEIGGPHVTSVERS